MPIAWEDFEEGVHKNIKKISRDITSGKSLYHNYLSNIPYHNISPYFKKFFPEKESKNLQDVVCIIPHKPNHPYLEDALKSLNGQSIRPAKIILCIDGLKDFVLKYKSQIPIEIINFKKTCSPFYMVNEIIQNISTPYILIQDSDDVSHPLRLETLYFYMLKKKCDAVGSNIINLSEDSKLSSIGVFPANPSETLLRSYGHVALYPSMLFSRKSYKDIGGFSQFASFGMDTEFVIKMSLKKCFINISNILYIKRKREGSLTESIDTGFGSQRRSGIEQFTRRRYNEYVKYLK